MENDMKNKLFTLLAAMALLSVVGAFYAAPAIAQTVRAALVKNLDEPGRNPYMHTSYASCTSLYTQTCQVFLPAPPAGKRLVVQYVSAGIEASGGITGSYLLNTGAPVVVLPGRTNSDPGTIA